MEMLAAPVVVYAVATLDNRPEGFDPVRVRLAPNVLPGAVRNGFVIIPALQVRVALVVVCVNDRVGFHMVVDEFGEGRSGFQRFGDDLARMRPRSHDGELARRTPAHAETLVRVFILFAPAYITSR